MKKILILFCGGTIVMAPNAKGSHAPLKEYEAQKILFHLEPQLTQYADFDIENVANIDSTNMTPEEWNYMANAIFEKYNDYDAFLVTHGTDTMAYSASALSFGLQNIGKPIVFTGSQIAGSELTTDAKRNMRNSVRLCLQNISGVFIVFSERILRGVHATKVHESKLDAYRSLHKNDAGSIDLEITIHESVPKRHSEKPILCKGFQKNIMVYTVTPGMDPENLFLSIQQNPPKGIILLGYGPGNIPYTFEKCLQLAQEKKIPVVIGSQCLYGSTDLLQYDVGSFMLSKGVIEACNMTLEALTTKLMWALEHYSYEEIAEIMKKNVAEEL